VPALDDAFVQDWEGTKTVSDLRAKIRSEMEQQKKDAGPRATSGRPC